MNSNAQNWIAALRSGLYHQGQDGLRTDDGYCCLGVACDLYRQVTGHGEWIPSVSTLEEWEEDDVHQRLLGGEGTNPDRFYTFESDNERSLDSFTLSHVVQDWLGMRTADGMLGQTDGGMRTSGSLIQSLTALNDSGDYSFVKLADIIEEHEEDLFF